jgi:hypothetical protein
MALFGFGKKPEPAMQASKVPVTEVMRMRKQGLSNSQIVQALQRNGFQTHEIFDALSQVDIRPGSPIMGFRQTPATGQPGMGVNTPLDASGPGSLGQPPIVAPPFADDTDATINGPQGLDELPEIGAAQPQQPELGGLPIENEPVFREEPIAFSPSTAPERYDNPNVSADVEEIAEAIIEEKWQDLMKDLNKLIDWKDKVEQRVAVLEQRFGDMKSSFDNLQKGVVEKVADYDKSVKDVGSEMKALEQVFQKIIPTLSENVNELSRITKGMKPQLQKKP